MTSSRTPDPDFRKDGLEAATLDDLKALLAIDRASPSPWTEAALQSELGLTPPTVYVLRTEDADNTVTAFVITRTVDVEMDIVNLAVSPLFRRRGHARALIVSLIEQAASRGVRRAYLEVRESNAPARGLYRGLGFEETQRRRNFYRDPTEDAILMSREIEPSTRLKGPRNAC